MDLIFGINDAISFEDTRAKITVRSSATASRALGRVLINAGAGGMSALGVKRNEPMDKSRWRRRHRPESVVAVAKISAHRKMIFLSRQDAA